MHSKMVKSFIKTSEHSFTPIIITMVRTQNDTNGNPRFAVQVWIDRHNTTGKLWTPKISGYRLNKNDQYIMQSYGSDEDIAHFVRAFQNAVYQFK